MIRSDVPAIRILVFTVATTTMFGCAPPDTDIVATNTEQVGDYYVVATHDGDTLHANVCIAVPRNASDVANRVLQQLMSRGYRTITLDMYAPTQRPVQRVVWTPETRTDGPVTAAPPQHFCQTTSQRSRGAAEP
jgi:hypothetical protein